MGYNYVTRGEGISLSHSLLRLGSHGRKTDTGQEERVDEGGEGGILLVKRWNKFNYFNKRASTLHLIIFDL